MDGLHMAVIPQQVLDDLMAEVRELKQLIRQAQQPTDEWIEAAEVRRILGISVPTWQRYRDAKIIKFSQIGKKIYVRRSDLDAFLEKNSIS